MENNTSSAVSEQTAETENSPKRPRKKRFYEITKENDIRYKGFLSYRYLKILGWVMIVLACLGTSLKLYSIISEQEEAYESTVNILSFGKDLAVPLLLIAAFATVLNGRGNYKRLILVNTSAALGLAALGLFIYHRYILGIGEAFLGDRELAKMTVDALFSGEDSEGFIAYNIFIDFTLCTLVLFFINYKPQRFFQGKKIYIFRSLVILPLAYEVASICLKLLASTGALALPIWVFPFLTAKPPVSFLLFLAIARYFKNTEYKLKKNGKTHEDYKNYLKTNHNALRFSKKLSLYIILFSILDIVIVMFISVMYFIIVGNPGADSEDITKVVQMMTDCGFGKTVGMILIVPVILLFNYTKTHKNAIIDMMIPVGGVAAIAVIYIDGLITAICEYLKTMMATM